MVRAKFKCDDIQPAEINGDSFNIMLHPVISGSEENESFFRYTPGGEIRLQCLNPAATEQFEVGKEYYVDFTPANEAEVNLEPGGESN